MTAGLLARRDYALDSLVSRRILRTEIIPGGDNVPTGVTTARKPCHNSSELTAGEGALAGARLERVLGDAL